MKVYGLTDLQLETVLERFGGALVYDNYRRISRNAAAFRLIPDSSAGLYARRSGSWDFTTSTDRGWRHGRKLRATCYHGFRDFIAACFDAGATRVQSTGGDWRSWDDFRTCLHELADQNVGSLAYPVTMIELCTNHDWDPTPGRFVPDGTL